VNRYRSASGIVSLHHLGRQREAAGIAALLGQ
jgi:hypothetical protein